MLSRIVPEMIRGSWAAYAIVVPGGTKAPVVQTDSPRMESRNNVFPFDRDEQYTKRPAGHAPRRRGQRTSEDVRASEKEKAAPETRVYREPKRMTLTPELYQLKPYRLVFHKCHSGLVRGCHVALRARNIFGCVSVTHMPLVAEASNSTG
jgi:hypothetical protein